MSGPFHGTGATLFTGFGGADLGMKAAGIDVLWGIEIDDAIAGVARANGLHVTTQDVTEADPADFDRVDFLHASPVCKSFSVAKAGREELEIDRKAAEATARFVRALLPSVVTLENVWGYRQSESWAIIYRELMRLGYGVGFAKLNAADYGVPQTRERMIVWAVLNGVAPTAPTPTHAENPPAPGFFGDTLPRWIGWHAAIEDLLPSLPDSQLAPWQLKRLPDDLRTLLVGAGGFDGNVVQSGADSPAFTVTANHNQDTVRGVLVDGDNAGKEGPIHRKDATPSPSVSQSTKPETGRASCGAQPRGCHGQVARRTLRASCRPRDGAGIPDPASWVGGSGARPKSRATGRPNTILPAKPAPGSEDR